MTLHCILRTTHPGPHLYCEVRDEGKMPWWICGALQPARPWTNNDEPAFCEPSLEPSYNELMLEKQQARRKRR